MLSLFTAENLIISDTYTYQENHDSFHRCIRVCCLYQHGVP